MAKFRWFWFWVLTSIFFRLLLIFFTKKNLNLGSRPEIATPVTSLRRLAEGYWLKQSSMSPYSGSMYHGSPLLLSVLGPLTVKRIEGQPSHLLCSLLFVIADLITAMLIRATGNKLQLAYSQSLKLLNVANLVGTSAYPNTILYNYMNLLYALNYLEVACQYSMLYFLLYQKVYLPSTLVEMVSAGNIAGLIYLWNPLTIITCVGQSTSPIENLMIVLSLYGACSRLAPLAAFGWVAAMHLSLYPAILIIPIILLIGHGPDTPSNKLFLQRNSESNENHPVLPANLFSWRPVVYFILWASFWSAYILILCSLYLNQYGGLSEMFKRTHGFILTVGDLSPNIGVLWYFFAEVFDFFRDFFLIVFHVNILFMLLPLAIRLNHRPCFLAFVYITISSMLKSYPSIGDSSLYLALLGLFVNELADMKLSFFLFCGYVGVTLLGPVMHNLWIWRGTGNANFYFATAMAYACLQIILVVESVSAMLHHDRKIRKQSTM